MTGQTEVLGNGMYKEEGGCTGQGMTTAHDPVLMTASYQNFSAQHKKSKYAVHTRGRPGASFGDRSWG